MMYSEVTNQIKIKHSFLHESTLLKKANNSLMHDGLSISLVRNFNTILFVQYFIFCQFLFNLFHSFIIHLFGFDLHEGRQQFFRIFLPFLVCFFVLNVVHFFLCQEHDHDNMDAEHQRRRRRKFLHSSEMVLL